MKGVDLTNQLMSYYELNRKIIKCEKNIENFNSFIIYKNILLKILHKNNH